MCMFPSIENYKKSPVFSWFSALETTGFWLPSQILLKKFCVLKNLRIFFKLLILISYIPHTPLCLVLLKQPVKQIASW